MNAFSAVPSLNCARCLALPVSVLQNAKHVVLQSAKRATSQFSIAAHSSERLANVIAGDRDVFKFSALNSHATFWRPNQSLFSAEVC